MSSGFNFLFDVELIVLGFNDMSILVGHFVSSLREMEKREETVNEMKKRDRAKKRKTDESEETEEIKTFPLYPYLLQG